jgi:rubrerythrin
MLKNAKTEYFNEHEEIATYLGIETLATKVGDTDTAKMARGIRREEERMAKFLEGQIKSLSNAVAIEEIPAAERRPRRAPARGRASSNGASASTAKRSTTRRTTAKRASTKRSTGPKRRAKATAGSR